LNTGRAEYNVAGGYDRLQNDTAAARSDDPRRADAGDPHTGVSDDPRVDPAPRGPTAQSKWENAAAGDDAMQDDLTEERQITPAQREEVAHEQTLDP